jgi:hypothetical protein
VEELNSAPEEANKLPKWLTTVTPLSKIIAMILFILLPFVGFYMGMKYQEKTNIAPVVIDVNKSVNLTPTPTAAPFLVYPITQTNLKMDTLNWKTYSLTAYPIKYLIKFPPDWKNLSNGDGGSSNYVSPDKLVDAITESSVRGLEGRDDTIEKVANLAITNGEIGISRNTLKVDGHDALIQESTSNNQTIVWLYISGFASKAYNAADLEIGFSIDKNRETLAREYIQNIISTIKFIN